MNPKFSIIVCSFNNARSLKRCIDSIINQTIEDFEILIIDNESTDGTFELIQQFQNDKVQFISEKDEGIYNAINKGINLSKGEIISILHADNTYIDFEVLSEVLNLFTKKNLACVYSNILIVNDNDKTIRDYTCREYNPLKLKFGWVPAHPGVFVSREAYKSLGVYNEKFIISSDYDFLLRLFSSQTMKIDYLNKHTVKMLSGGISNSGIKNHIRKWKEDYTTLKEHSPYPKITLFFKIIRKLPQLKFFRD